MPLVQSEISVAFTASSTVSSASYYYYAYYPMSSYSIIHVGFTGIINTWAYYHRNPDHALAHQHSPVASTKQTNTKSGQSLTFAFAIFFRHLQHATVTILAAYLNYT